MVTPRGWWLMVVPAGMVTRFREPGGINSPFKKKGVALGSGSRVLGGMWGCWQVLCGGSSRILRGMFEKRFYRLASVCGLR